jgi:hypothetical protein
MPLKREGSAGLPERPRGGFFLKSECIGFKMFPAAGGREAPKRRYMKSAKADFIRLETS